MREALSCPQWPGGWYVVVGCPWSWRFYFTSHFHEFCWAPASLLLRSRAPPDLGGAPLPLFTQGSAPLPLPLPLGLPLVPRSHPRLLPPPALHLPVRQSNQPFLAHTWRVLPSFASQGPSLSPPPRPSFGADPTSRLAQPAAPAPALRSPGGESCLDGTTKPLLGGGNWWWWWWWRPMCRAEAAGWGGLHGRATSHPPPPLQPGWQPGAGSVCSPPFLASLCPPPSICSSPPGPPLHRQAMVSPGCSI